MSLYLIKKQGIYPCHEDFRTQVEWLKYVVLVMYDVTMMFSVTTISLLMKSSTREWNFIIKEAVT